MAELAARRAWNISWPYLCETGAYLTVTAQNIPQRGGKIGFISNILDLFGLKIRVSVVRFRPLATIKTLIHLDFPRRKIAVGFGHRDRFPFCFQTLGRRADRQSDRAGAEACGSTC